MTARQDYLSWDSYFMGVAALSSMRSKDPNTRVGACIVNPENRIVGIGYNGFPLGCSDHILPWEKVGNRQSDTKYMYVIHAEQNAILNASRDLSGHKLYVTLFPCNECAKMIIQSKVSKVVYLKANDREDCIDSIVASKRMFDLSGVTYEQLTPTETEILLKF